MTLEETQILAGIAFGFSVGLGVGLILAYFLFSNFVQSKGEKRLLSCMIACPYPFGTPEFDAWVTECVSKPGRNSPHHILWFSALFSKSNFRAEKRLLPEIKSATSRDSTMKTVIHFQSRVR